MKNVFTPLDSKTGERLRFPMSKIVVLQGDIDVRKKGLKAYIEIRHKKEKTSWKRYKVYGESCSLENCNCDAMIKEIA